MSLTLGEKLREAREERGFTLSDVAEQTRISSLYLESIENDDYRILPGGIFNKGFVKSFAKLVGINEQEALADYAVLLSQTTVAEEDEYKRYRPEVLTDDRSMGSMVPTIIVAVIILGVMSAGLLFLVDYMRGPAEGTVANSVSVSNDNTAEDANESLPVEIVVAPPDMDTVKVIFKSLSESVSLTAINDGKTVNNVITTSSPASFEPKESLKLSYSKSLANVVEMTINGKFIALPAEPLTPRRNAIEFEINKENLAQIWTSGKISPDAPAAVPVTEQVSGPAPAPAVAEIQPTQTPVASPTPATPRPRPSATPNANVTPRPSPVKTPEPTRKPANTPARPATNDNRP